MPKSTPTVVVTGANSRTGRDLLPHLANLGAHVIALVRNPEELPAHEVIDNWMESPRAVEALANASVVIHLSGVFAAPDWAGYEAGTVATTRRVVDAMSPDARLVYMSYVGADSTHDNWYIKAKGQAEDLVRLVSDSVIFRIHALVGGREAPAPFELMMCQPSPGAPVQVIGDGTQRFRPIYTADVLDALTKAAMGEGKAGTYDLVGPSEFALVDLPALINGHTVPISRVTAREAAVVPGPPATVADLLAHPTTPDDPRIVAEAFDLALTRPETTWPVTQTPAP